MNDVSCPKCGGETKPVQIKLRKTQECNHCGRLPFRDGKPEWGRGGFQATNGAIGLSDMEFPARLQEQGQ